MSDDDVTSGGGGSHSDKELRKRYVEERRRYEELLRSAQQAVIEAWRGSKVADLGFGGPVLYEWALQAGGRLHLVGDTNASVERTSNEKKPVRLTVRLADGQQFFFDRKASEDTRAQAFARSVALRSTAARTEAPSRDTNVARAMAALARVREPEARLTDAMRAAGVPGVTAPMDRLLTAEEIVEVSANSFIKAATSWIGGASPTVRRSYVKRISVAGAGVGVIVALGLVGANEQNEERRADVASDANSEQNAASVSIQPVLETNSGGIRGALAGWIPDIELSSGSTLLSGSNRDSFGALFGVDAYGSPSAVTGIDCDLTTTNDPLSSSEKAFLVTCGVTTAGGNFVSASLGDVTTGNPAESIVGNQSVVVMRSNEFWAVEVRATATERDLNTTTEAPKPAQTTRPSTTNATKPIPTTRPRPATTNATKPTSTTRPRPSTTTRAPNPTRPDSANDGIITAAEWARIETVFKNTVDDRGTRYSDWVDIEMADTAGSLCDAVRDAASKSELFADLSYDNESMSGNERIFIFETLAPYACEDAWESLP